MPSIETERLILRPISEEDAEAMFMFSQNVNVGFNAGWKPHSDIEETHEIIKMIFLDRKDVYGIELKEADMLCGSIGLVPDAKRQNDQTRMLGYALGENYWNKGYMTEAAQALIRFGFDSLHLDLISAYCYPFNTRSKRVLEKCGFKYEGRLRFAEKHYGGEYLTMNVFQ